MSDELLRKYAPLLTDPVAPTVRDARLMMDEQGGVAVYYAPFEYVNPSARLVLVGITPGPTQMNNANLEARRALRAGLSPAEVLRLAKLTAAFSGEPMRSNLLRQLTHWGVHRWLGIDDPAALFGTQADLVQTTSLLCFPVFVRGEDYRGSPDMRRHPLLRRYLIDHFVQEVRQLPDALFFGLGPKVQGVLDSLVRDGIIPQERVVSGLLHPSPNNTYRIDYLVGARSVPPPYMTRPESYDAGRERFRQAFGR